MTISKKNAIKALDFFIHYLLPDSRYTVVSDLLNHLKETGKLESCILEFEETADRTIMSLTETFDMEKVEAASSEISDVVHACILQRCVVFENYLSTLKRGFAFETKSPGDLLRYGLIQYWKESKLYSPLFRNN